LSAGRHADALALFTQWEAIKMSDGKWTLRNLGVNVGANPRRFLSADANVAHARLRGAINPEANDSTFVITPIGSSGGCRCGVSVDYLRDID